MPNPEYRFPKFLTQGLAELAVSTILDRVLNGPTREYAPQNGCCVVIYAPQKKITEDPAEADTRYAVLHEHAVGDPRKWKVKFDELARNKAIQLIERRNDGSTAIKPHLLFSGDAPYFGAVEYEGLVVACSGPPGAMDRAISGMVAHLLIGLAHQAWMNSDDKANKAPFLT